MISLQQLINEKRNRFQARDAALWSSTLSLTVGAVVTRGRGDKLGVGLHERLREGPETGLAGRYRVSAA